MCLNMSRATTTCLRWFNVRLSLISWLEARADVCTVAYNLVWPYAMGNCHLDRHTEKYLLEAGSWSTIELETPKEEDAWQFLPRVSGRLVKWGSGAK